MLGFIFSVVNVAIRGAAGGAVAPPAGFVFLIDPDGAILTDADGAYLVEHA